MRLAHFLFSFIIHEEICSNTNSLFCSKQHVLYWIQYLPLKTVAVSVQIPTRDDKKQPVNFTRPYLVICLCF